MSAQMCCAAKISSIAACVLALVSASAEAKRIYSYTDENGVVHFSDSKPEGTTAPVKEQLVDVDPAQRLKLRESGPKDDRRYSLWNGYGGPVEVLISFESQHNVISEPPLPASVVIGGEQTTPVLTVQPLDPSLGWSYQFQYRYVPGNPGARHNDQSVYRLPFRGSSTIHQAFGGKFSHTAAENYHAVDFALDIGTPILAARGGVVMSVERDFHESGTDLRRLGDRANHIRIVHDDGTMAVYAHLELESALVGVGDSVRTGQHIADSGNTGFSSGPHLHFVVQRNAGGALVSVPFQFTDNDKRITPTEGAVLGGLTIVE